MGSGKTIVEFFSADIVFRVCKWRQNFLPRKGSFSSRTGEHEKCSRRTNKYREITLEKWNTDFGSIGN